MPNSTETTFAFMYKYIQSNKNNIGGAPTSVNKKTFRPPPGSSGATRKTYQSASSVNPGDGGGRGTINRVSEPPIGSTPKRTPVDNSGPIYSGPGGSTTPGEEKEKPPTYGPPTQGPVSDNPIFSGPGGSTTPGEDGPFNPPPNVGQDDPQQPPEPEYDDEWPEDEWPEDEWPEEGGEQPQQPAGPTPTPLGAISWWANRDSIQPLLRGWTEWLREFVESNMNNAPINPFDIDPDAPEAPAAAKGIFPGFTSSNQVLSTLKNKLGITFDENDDATTKWQKFINAIPSADFESQQLLASLRYDSNSNRWWSADISQLVNPKHI